MNILVILWSISISMSDITYDPEVAEIINSVSQDSLVSTVASLSGEKSVMIAGEKDSISCRFAYSPGSYKTALWLKEQLEERGVSAELDPFIALDFIDVDLLPSGRGWMTANHRFIAWPNNDLFYTENGGYTWQQVIYMDTTTTWGNLAAVSDDTCWCAAGTKILRTVDGQTWETMRDKEPEIAAICAGNNMKGWATGKWGYMVSTTDGWTTFEEGYPIPGSGTLNHIDFVSAMTGWLASKKELWTTSDGAETWTSLGSPLDSITELEFLDSLHGFLTGIGLDSLGVILRTTDGGASWDTLMDTLHYYPYDIAFSGSSSVWVVGEIGLSLYSPDAGDSWIKKETGAKGLLRTVDFTGDGRGILIGPTQARYTQNGSTWQNPDTADLYTMYNVIGTMKGEDSLEVMICAHHDAALFDSITSTIYTPGADDNASGCAAVLEAARLLEDQAPKHTLKFVCFGGEELGLWGAYHYAYSKDPDVVFGFLNADMIAYDGNDDRIQEVHIIQLYMPESGKLGELYRDVSNAYDIDLIQNIDNTYYASDCYELWTGGMPGISIGESHESVDFNPFYHTVDETLDKLNLPYFTEASKACVGWMAHMANLDSLVGVEEKPMRPLEEPIVLRLSSNIIRSDVYLEITSPVTPVTLCIYDATGRRVKTLTPPKAGERLSGDLDLTVQRISIDVSDLPAGVYWVSVEGTRGPISEKFILVR